MVVNTSKSKSMLITSQRLTLSPKTTLHIDMGNTPIEAVHEHKTLGLVIDQHLTWNSHLRALTKLTAQKVYQLSKIKHFLDEHPRLIFFKSFIQSLLDLYSTIWDMSRI